MTQPKKLVIYHKNCLDGFGAAFAAWLALGDSATYIPLDYSERSKWMGRFKDQYSKEEVEIYILDFSFTESDTEFLIAISSEFVWLDHHKTAFEAWHETELEYIAETNATSYIILDNSKSGALLAWEYFHPTPAPTLVYHIDDRDRWQWKMEGTKEVTLALSQLPQEFVAWEKVFRDSESLKKTGEVIQSYYDTQLQRAIAATRESCTILGQVGLCCNLPPLFASEAGNLLAAESGTFGATWFLRPKRLPITLCCCNVG